MKFYFVHLVFIIAAVSFNPSSQNEFEPALKNMEDIEALSYFVLTRNSILHQPDKLLQDSHDHLINGTIDERTFQDFLLKIKEGRVFQNNQLHNASCETLRKEFIDSVRMKNTTLASYYENSKKLDSLCQATTQCQSPSDFISLITGNDEMSSHESQLALNQAIVRLCPLILAQVHDQGCYAADAEKLVKLKPSPGAVWGFGFLFVTIISFCSIIGVALMPFLDRKSFLTVLNVCEGLGKTDSIRN